MKNLVKIFLATGILVGCLFSAKLIIELYESKKKTYIDVE